MTTLEIDRRVIDIDPAEAKQFAEILLAAAERARTHGWQRGRIGWLDGPNCAAGLVEYSMVYSMVTFSDDLDRFYAIFAHYAGIPLRAPWEPEARNSVIEWNDNRNRTKDDVIFAFEKAAADLKALADVV